MNLHDKKILITGAHGFVGKNLVNYLIKDLEISPRNIATPNRHVLDCSRQDVVENYFDFCMPDIVIHLAGKVGGVKANQEALGEFYFENIMMGTLLMEEARRNGVEKFIALGAGCGYPNFLDPPYSEDDLFCGLPEMSSYGYSMAKKMLVVQSWAYKEQYDFNSTILLPANLYGPYDNFNLEKSHVIPALVRKFSEAYHFDKPVEVWGKGNATREFLYVGDMVKAIVEAIYIDDCGPFNVGTGVETSIKEVVDHLNNILEVEEIIYDRSKPTGQKKRYYDMTKFQKVFGYIPQTSIEEGLKKTVDWYETYNGKIRK